MLSKIKNLLQFAGHKKSDYTPPVPPVQSVKVMSSAILYRDCNKLPLDIFIDCFIDDDFSGLGEGPELPEVWDKIYIEYCQLSQDGSYNEVFEIMKEINDFRAKITIVSNCLTYLQMQYDADVVAVLNTFALRCTLKPDDQGRVMVDKLNQVVARMKKWFPMLKQKEKDLDALRKENTGKIGREYFDDALELMSEVKGYQVEASKITVARFCRALLKMKNDAIKKQTANANRKDR